MTLQVILRSSLQLPRVGLGLVELTWRSSTALFLAPCIACGTVEIQRHRQVCRARRRGPRTPPKTMLVLDCKSQQSRIKLVIRLATLSGSGLTPPLGELRPRPTTPCLQCTTRYEHS